MSSCCTLYNEDRHYADPLLEPLRFCLSNLRQISHVYSCSHGCKVVAIRTGQIILLLIATVIAALISLIAFALKTCQPVDHFTPREAYLKFRGLSTSSGGQCDFIFCDLRSGVIYGGTKQNQYFYWEPGQEGFTTFALNQGFTTPGGVKINAKCKIAGAKELHIGEAKHTLPPLTEDQVSNLAQNATSISYAPYLGIIVARINNELRYMTPPNQVWQPVPTKKTWIPTGGRIHPDGSVDGETLIQVQNP